MPIISPTAISPHRIGKKFDWSSYWETLMKVPQVPKFYESNPPSDAEDAGVRCVVFAEGEYHLFSETNFTTNPRWTINKRTSKDGIIWTDKSSPLLLPGAGGSYDEYGQADPTVIYDGPGDWKMWFDALRAATPVWNSLGYATSSDGINWANQGAVLSVGANGTWDDAFIHHPCVIKVDGVYYMFYSGNGVASVGDIGLATSPNGVTWTKHASNPIIVRGSAGEWDVTYIRPSAPVKLYDKWYMFYWGYNSTVHSMGLAESSDLITWTKIGKLMGDASGTINTRNVLSSHVLLKEGTNPKDKIFQIWYNTSPRLNQAYALCFASVSNNVANTLKAGPFTKVETKKYGDSTVSTSAPVDHAANYIYLYRIVVSDSITPDAIKAYFPYGTNTGTARIKAALYADSAGQATDLIAEAEETTFSRIAQLCWHRFKFTSPPTLAAGTYWVGIWSTALYQRCRTAGGAVNTFGNTPVAYGNFPDPINVTPGEKVSDHDVYLAEFDDASETTVWNTALTTSPSEVYFNGVKGNKKLALIEVTAEFDWFWDANVLYIYSIENPDIRYQILYK